jgi:flagellin-specific chaperone FliS
MQIIISNTISKRRDIVTADRGKLVILLYEGALGYLHKAKECAQKNDFREKPISLTGFRISFRN